MFVSFPYYKMKISTSFFENILFRRYVINPGQSTRILNGLNPSLEAKPSSCAWSFALNYQIPPCSSVLDMLMSV